MPPHRQFHTIPSLLDSRVALPNSYPNPWVLRKDALCTIFMMVFGTWYDPPGTRTQDLTTWEHLEVDTLTTKPSHRSQKYGISYFYYVLVSVSPWKRTWYRQRDKVDFITLLLITFHWLIETMLDHVTVVFSYAMAVVLNLKTHSVNIYSGFKG